MGVIGSEKQSGRQIRQKKKETEMESRQVREIKGEDSYDFIVECHGACLWWEL